jgi:branched-chain amino acid transport system ATP-binding protein
VTEQPLLDVRSLSVAHGGLLALDDVDLAVGRGSITGLIGPNGAGKTTFIDALTGFTRIRSGRMDLDGRPLVDLAPHARARLGLVRTFQSLELFDDLTVRQNLRVASTTPTWRSTLADAFRRRDAKDDATDELLDELGLLDHADRRPSALSNGARHLVALARAVVARPSLVLLDEPAAGLDTTETAELAAILRRLPLRGTSVLLVDHDMALVLGVCDEVHVLDFGRVIATGPPSQVRSDPAVVSAYLGHGDGSG